LYEIGRCVQGSSNANSRYICGSFVLIWGHAQCSKISNQIFLGSYDYLKDLKHAYYACHGLLYGKEDQTLLIDDKP
jgi:hypothetical protein